MTGVAATVVVVAQVAAAHPNGVARAIPSGVAMTSGGTLSGGAMMIETVVEIGAVMSVAVPVVGAKCGGTVMSAVAVARPVTELMIRAAVRPDLRGGMRIGGGLRRGGRRRMRLGTNG